ncbi:MAG: CusA/CzcA family heavy metal efflux RND transporter [Pseudomonadota bacterium]
MTSFVLKHKLLMLAFAILIMVSGYYSYRQLPLDAFPDVSPNLVQIFTETDGLAPEEIEKYVTYPVETAMNGLPGVDKIRSVSNFGLSVVNVYFEDGMDIYFARQLVNERLQEARDEIPDGFGDPKLGPISTGMGLILFYYLHDETGQRSLEELRTIHDRIVKFNLQTVPGVTEVLGIGGYVKQYHIMIRPDALLRYNIPLKDVIEKIKANNLNVGAQFIEKNREELVVRSVGLVDKIEDLNQIVITSEQGTPVYLQQLADIKVGGAVRRGLQTRNGEEEVVAGMVIKLFGTNSSTVIERVEKKIKEINGILPAGFKIISYYEQKTLVQASVKTVTDALLQGIALVIIILMIFLGGFRTSIVVAFSIPFSVLFAMLGMNYFGISANLMSFGGLAIAIGMIVDGTIVIVENVERLLRQSPPNASRRQIVLAACQEVSRPILFAVTIVIVVFLPLFTLQGVEGKTFRPLAYTVALSMFGSLMFAMLLAPVLSHLLMRQPNQPQKGGLLLRILITIYKPIIALFIRLRFLAVSLALSLIVVGLIIFPRLGSEFTPTLQEGTIMLRLTMAPSIALTESQRLTMMVEKQLLKIPEITEVVSRIGRGEIGAHTDPVNSAEMFILLKPKEQWRVNSQEALLAQIRQELGEITGVTLNFTQPIAATIDELLEGVRAELAIKLFADAQLSMLKAKAEEIAAVVQQVPGAADIQVDQVIGAPQLLIKLNRQAIARYGLNVSEVQSVIQAAVGGAQAGFIFEGTQRFNILVRYPPEYRNTKAAIEKIIIQSDTGIRVPLIQLIDIEEIVSSRQITRENNQRFITIQANVVERDIGSFVEAAQQAIAAKVTLPPGYLMTWGGQFRLQQEANKRLAVVVPITLLMIFILLFSSFNSLKNAILIFLNIPLALVGGIVALWIAGENLSVPSSVGFIALFGIALGNGMVLVTYLNQLVCEGLPLDEAAIKGACLRLRPVLMTALTTALGLLPLLYSTGTGSEVQRPLATVVLGGLITSTVLTLLVIPALYKWFATRPK